MEIKHEYHNDLLLIQIDDEDGPLVQTDIDIFIKEILQLMSQSHNNKIAFDMSLKKYLNSWGLGQLIKAKDVLYEQGIKLYLINPTQRVSSLLSMVGVDGFFKSVSSLEEIN